MHHGANESAWAAGPGAHRSLTTHLINDSYYWSARVRQKNNSTCGPRTRGHQLKRLALHSHMLESFRRFKTRESKRKRTFWWIVCVLFVLFILYFVAPVSIDASVDVSVQKRVGARAEHFHPCTWPAPSFQYATDKRSTQMEETVRILNAANITYALTDGSLLGAYRHGGPLPCDGDMDIVFPVWLNGMSKCSDGPGETLCGHPRNYYIKPAMEWLRQRIPSVSISPRRWGGFRATFAGGRARPLPPNRPQLRILHC